MKTESPQTVRIDIASRFDMLDMVQTVLVQISQTLGFGEEAQHYMTVAIRESVVNAIKHGNRLDETKRVAVEFTIHSDALEVSVEDQGKGFDPRGVLDPLAPENLLKADGRGIFFMRQFMDDVRYEFPRDGGTVVRMRKRF